MFLMTICIYIINNCLPCLKCNRRGHKFLISSWFHQGEYYAKIAVIDEKTLTRQLNARL